jgi:hypothetical protein
MSRVREDVITVLQDVSSKDRHYEWYKTTGGTGNLAAELWTYWLKDGYAPHHADFIASLTVSELEKLERFTQFFEARLKEFPIRFEKLMVNVYWLSVVEYASSLLSDFAACEDNEDTAA